MKKQKRNQIKVIKKRKQTICENLDDEAKQKICKAAKKIMKTI